MSWLHALLLLVTVFSIVEFGECDSEMPRKTYVGPFEQTAQLLLRSGRTLDKGIAIVKMDLKNIVTHVPLLNRVTNKKVTIADILNPLKPKIKAIFPGTYWCGDGDISPNKKDLGLFEQTDACCRAHDSCPDGIPANEVRDGLLNNGIFTRSLCECDQEFYDCLKKVNSIIATDIGTTYFNILRPQCFKKYYPIVGCKKHTKRRLLYDKCEEYIYNTTQPETLEWFDNPDFLVL